MQPEWMELFDFVEDRKRFWHVWLIQVFNIEAPIVHLKGQPLLICISVKDKGLLYWAILPQQHGGGNLRVKFNLLTQSP